MNTARTSLVLALLCLPVACPLGATEATGSQGKWAAAGEMLKAGEYVAALEAAQEALVESPREIVLLRIKGVALMELGREDEAVEVLHQAVQTDPSSISCWYFLAQALAYRGSVPEALQILNQICKVAPDSEYAHLAGQVLPDLQNLIVVEQVVQDDKRWNLTLRLGGQYDDNVPARPDDGPVEPSTDSFLLTLSAFLQVRPMDQKLDDLPVALALGYAIYQSFHASDVWDSLDLTSQNLQLSLTRDGRIADQPYQCSIKGVLSDAMLDFEGYSRSGGLDGTFSFQWNKWTSSAFSYGIQWNNFSDDGFDPALVSRDGTDQVVSFRQRFYLFNNRLVLGGGYLYRRSDTEGSNFDFESNGATASLQLALPWKVFLGTDFVYQSQDYTEYTPTPTRLDDVYTVTARVSRPLWWEHLTAELSYTHVSSGSTLPISEYHRNLYGIALVYSY